MEQAAQGSEHSPELLEFKKQLNSALKHGVWVLCDAAWSRGSGLMIFVGSFQLKLFYDSMVRIGLKNSAADK